MKKLLAGTLTAAFALGLTACGQQEECSAKPVIYLYPEQETTVSVSLDYAGTLTATYPAYENGWTVTAEPDGTLYDENGNEYSYLFWEGENNTDYDFSKGFCVAGADTADFLREKLAEIGLTPREYNEFIVYWLPKMQDNPYNLISFQSEAYTDAAKPVSYTHLDVYKRQTSGTWFAMTLANLDAPSALMILIMLGAELK